MKQMKKIHTIVVDGIVVFACEQKKDAKSWVSGFAAINDPNRVKITSVYLYPHKSERRTLKTTPND